MEQKSMNDFEINPNADIGGIRPEDCLSGVEYTIRMDDTEKFPLRMEERETNNGKGKFKQFSLFLIDSDGRERVLNYLFEKHLAPLARAYGNSPLKWVGKTVVVTGFQTPRNGKNYWDVKLDA